MWLYERRLIELEGEFENAGNAIREIQENLADTEEAGQGAYQEVDRARVKLQLDAALGLVRLIKEQMAFYIRLGERYDCIRAVEAIVDELTKEDAALIERVLRKLDAEWASELAPSAEGVQQEPECGE